MKKVIPGTLPEQDLLTPKEVAEYLRVKERTVNKYIAEGKIPPDVVKRIGKTVRFVRLKFLEWLFRDGDSIDDIWKLLIEQSDNVVVVVDCDCTIQYINHTISGAERQEVLGTNMFKFIMPEYHGTLKRAVEHVFRTGEHCSIKTPGVRTDGITIWIKSEIKPIKDNSGQVINASFYLYNVTELRQTEESRRESEERFHFITKASIDAIVQINNAGELVFINEAATRLFGYKEEDIINKHFTEFIVELDLLKGREMFQKCLAGETVIGELRCFHKSGHEVPVLFTGTPVMKDDQLASIFGILRDHTHKKQTEAALIKTEEKYRALIEGSGEVPYKISLPDGKFIYISSFATDVFGYNPDEFLNRRLPFKKIIHPDYVGYVMEKWAELMKGKISPTYEYKIFDSEGNERWILQSTRGIFDQRGSIVAVEGIYKDITNYKRENA